MDDGRTALVTGASSGIGRAIALALGARGWRVWLVGRDTAALASAVEACGEGCVARRVDIGVDSEVRDLVDQVQQAGPLKALIHSAGAIALGRFAEASVEDLDGQYRTNVRAPYLLTTGLLPALKQAGGDVVFINSTASLDPRPPAGQYAATQAARRALADSLRQEVNAEGVRVLNVFPGRTATPLQERIHSWEDKSYRPERLMQPEDVAAMVVEAVDVPRTAEVTEIRIRPFLKPTQD